MTVKYHVELVLYATEDDEDSGDIDVVEDEIISRDYGVEDIARRYFWDLRATVLGMKDDDSVLLVVRDGLLELQEADEN